VIIELNEKLREYHEKFPIFGIILFTNAHPHVVKMLKDVDYRNALHEITGEQIAVFATLLFEGEYELPSCEPGTMSMLVPIWKEPHQNKKILSWFGLKDSKNLPNLVLFGTDNKEFYYKRYAIKSNSTQDTFNSLQEVLLVVANQVEASMNSDRKDLFKKAQWEIVKIQAKQKLGQILGIASLFRGVAGI